MLQFLTLLSMAVFVVADQLIKLLALNHLEPIGVKSAIPGVFQFSYVENTGAAFGSFSKFTGALSVFTAIILVAMIILLLSKKLKFGVAYCSLVLIISGGIGNLIDRIFRGYVIDYIEPLFINFAVFNFADILVTVGASVLIVYLIYDTIKDSKKSQAGKLENKDE